VFGTAINSSSVGLPSDTSGSMIHCAKEQKFMVFTWRTWRSQGCFLGSGVVSTGRTVLIEASSSSEHFHTTSLLSLPCLQDSGQQKGPNTMRAGNTTVDRPHVINLSLPQALVPRMAPSCALQTATALLIERFHTTIQPSASPVMSRLFDLMKTVECICAACPRSMYAG